MNTNNTPEFTIPVETPTQVQQIDALLGGNTVLLPIAERQKGPTFVGWQQVTVEAMSDPDYLARFTGGNIGVLLGKPSANLCSIDIDDDESVEAFTALNPQLAATLRTRGSRGANFWVRLEGEYPKLTKLKTIEGNDWGEWRADGGQTVIDGIHPNGNQYQRVVDASPVTVRFDDIQWPEHLVLPWLKSLNDELTEKYGPAFGLSKNGKLKLNQMFFVGKFAMEHHVLFEGDEEQFYCYNAQNGLWELKSENWLKAEFARDLRQAAEQYGQTSIALEATDSFTTALKNMLKGEVEKKGVFKKQRGLVHVKNGVLDLNEQPPVLHAFVPEDYSRNQIPIDVDEAADCPQFRDDVLCPALDDADISLFQRWCGSVLLGVNDAQRLMILSGEGGTGKSTLATIVESIVGAQNVAQLRTNHLADRFELFGCVGKSLLTGKDVAGNFLNTDGAYVIKALCGGDTVDAEKKGGGRVQLEGNFNILITSNSRLWLKLDGDASAWERRLLIIEFNKKRTSKTVPNLAAKLIREEGSGILNFMIEGAVLLLNELQQHGGYVLTDIQKARVERLVSESDSVRLFVRSSVHKSVGAQITTDELMEGYVRYCEQRGWHPLSAHAVERQLPEAMMQIHHASKRNDIMTLGGVHRGYAGMALKLEVVCR